MPERFVVSGGRPYAIYDMQYAGGGRMTVRGIESQVTARRAADALNSLLAPAWAPPKHPWLEPQRMRYTEPDYEAQYMARIEARDRPGPEWAPDFGGDR